MNQASLSMLVMTTAGLVCSQDAFADCLFDTKIIWSGTTSGTNSIWLMDTDGMRCRRACTPSWSCPGDISGPSGKPDDVIDVFDSLALLATWRDCQ